MSDQMGLPIAGGRMLPTSGLGLWKVDPSNAADLVYKAIELGYRHLDSACDYGNEQSVGVGIKRALDDKLCSRDQLWVTSKLWNTYHRPEHVLPALKKTLCDLRLEYLDLYMIHFPITLKYVPIEERYPPGWLIDMSTSSPKMETACVPIAETWGAMEELVKSGLVANLGVCNFGCSLLRDLLSYARVRPSVLQVESHPYLTQQKLLRYCQQENIAYTAFSPLGAGSYIPLGMATETDSVLNDPEVKKIAEAHQKSAAQVVLRWGVQRGTAVIPKTSRPERLQENLDIYSFELTDSEMICITDLNRNQRYNDPGVFCERAFGCFHPIFE